MKTIIDLTHTLTPTIPSWDGGCCFSTSIFLDYKDCVAPNLVRVQEIKGKAGSGTHMDAPAHFIEGGKTIDLLDLKELMTDCVVIRPGHEADENYLVMPVDIESFEKAHGKIEPGTFVIFHTGWDKYWNTPDKFKNDLKFPSVHPDTAKILLERNVSGIGIDTLSPDAVGDDFPVHVLILGAGKYIVENIANAGQLPAKGAKVLIMPIKIESGTEAPIRLVGIIE
jgi:kynurenine formamidase